MDTFGDLRNRADAALSQDRLEAALTDYVRLVSLRPADLDARLKVGDTLSALGRGSAAGAVYRRLAQHAARAGYPLRALVALKLLQPSDGDLDALGTSMAALYAKGAPHLGQGARQAPPDPTVPLPTDWQTGLPTGEALLELAERIGCRYDDGALFYPDKLMPIPLLSSLPPATFSEVVSAVKLLRAGPGAAVVAQGSEGRSFYIVGRGELGVQRSGPDGTTLPLANLHDGSIFGEMALLSPDPRSASVVTQTDSDLLEFDHEALSAMATDKEVLGGALATFARERLLQNTMATCGLFTPLDQRQRRDLMRRFVSTEVPAGTVVIREGKPGTGLFVVLRGQVAVTKEGPTGPQPLAVLGPAETFGEISLLNGEPTTATVTANEPASLLFLERSYFLRLVHGVPEIRAYLEQMSDERQLDTQLVFEGGEPPPPLSVAPDVPTACSLEVEVEVLV